VPPVADQVTAAFELPVTVEVNCCAAFVTMEAAVGLIATEMTGADTVTVALADLLVSATLVALIV
jgi:hypothetical protein